MHSVLQSSFGTRLSAGIVGLALVGTVAPVSAQEATPTGGVAVPLTTQAGTVLPASTAGFDSKPTALTANHNTVLAKIFGSLTRKVYLANDESPITAPTEDAPETGPTPDESGQLTPGESGEPSPTESEQLSPSESPSSNEDPNQYGESQTDLEEKYSLLSGPIDVADPFSVSGLTWAAGQELPAGSSVQIRTLDSGQWSAWYALEVEAQGGKRSGTEMNISGNSTGIQVRITQGEGPLPDDLRIEISYTSDGSQTIDDGEALTDVRPAENTIDDAVVNGTSENLTANKVAAPGAGQEQSNDRQEESGARQIRTVAEKTISPEVANIQPRSSWGANEAQMTWPVQYATFEGVIVHHTAGSNSYTQAQVKSTLQGIYRYHAVTNQWGDIGYNVLIDKFGGRWEGRRGTLAAASGKMAIGAHAVPRNSGTMGISVMGNYAIDNTIPSDTVINSISDVAAWKFASAGIDPRSTSPLKVPLPSEKSINSKLTPGSPLPRIAGHRDVSNTSCPGSIYQSLDAVRSQVATHYDELTKPANKAATWFLNDAWSGQANTSFTWGYKSDTALIGDWNGDGRDSVAIRRGKDFAITNDRAPQGEPVFTFSFGREGDEVLVGDWNGDGHDTFALRRGKTLYVSNNLNGGVAETEFTFGALGDQAIVGDWNGDGRDTLALRRGNTMFVNNTLAGGIAEISFTYGRVGDDLYAGRFSPTSRGDSVMVRRNITYFVTTSLKGGQADWVLDYGRVGDETLVGDWNNDGVDTLGVRRG